MSRNIDLTGSRWMVEWILNARQNGLLNPPIRSMHDLEPDERTEAIVCGSGPSLNDDLDALAKTPAIIIANHSNLSTLLYFHIRPDFVLITDSGEATFERIKVACSHFDVKDI